MTKEALPIAINMPELLCMNGLAMHMESLR